MLVVGLVVLYPSVNLNFQISPKSSFSKILFLVQSFMVGLWIEQSMEDFIAVALKCNSSSNR